MNKNNIIEKIDLNNLKVNAQDLVILALKSEGVCGDCYFDIVNLKVEDCDFESNTLKVNDKIINVAEKTMDIIKLAINEDFYCKTENDKLTNKGKSLQPSDYVCKKSISFNTDNVKCNRVIISARLKKVIDIYSNVKGK